MLRHVLTLQRPSFAILVMQELVGIRIVGDFQVLAVPEQFAAAIANADAAQQHRLRQWSGEIEIGASRRAGLAGLDPFLVMADGARQRFWRTLVFLVEFGRQQTGMLAAPPLYQHLAPVANRSEERRVG